MRRSHAVLLLCALALCGAGAAPASAQLVTESCGASSGVVLPGQAVTSAQGHFRLGNPDDNSGSVTSAQMLAALEEVRSGYEGFGWPLAPGAPYQVRVHTVSEPQVIVVSTLGDNPASSWNDLDAKTTCMLIPADATNLNTLKTDLAREYGRAIAHGIGALSGPNAPDAWLAEGIVVAMEDELYPAFDAPADRLPPAWEASLGEYSGPNGWLILRGLTERFGSGVSGGAEQVLQDVLELTSGRSPGGDNLSALEAAIAAKSSTLGQAFHDYAIAARHMQPCGGGAVPPYCFADANVYVASTGDRAAHSTLASIGGTLSAEVADDYALHWVALPPGRMDITVANTAAGGVLLGTVTCATANGLRRRPLGSGVPVGASQFLRAVDLTGCTDPTLVVTSSSRTLPNPSTSAKLAFSVTTAAPTAVLSAASFGGGSVVSSPAGIDCGTTCSAVFALGTTVTMTAKPGTGRRLAGWAGACTDKGACTITLDSDKSVAAGFELIPIAAPATTRPNVPVGPSAPGTVVAGDVTAPQVLISRPRFTKGFKKVRIELTCPAEEANRCTGPVELVVRAGGKRYAFTGEAVIGVAAGSSKTITYALTRTRQRRLAKVKRATAVVTATVRDDAFNRTTVRKSFRLRPRG